ncbi:MAG: PAS domain S-box protein, partial [archaeon]|nr:PAS domain S-box protein [archaeon]
QGNILKANKAMLEQLKYSEKAILKMHILDIHPSEKRDEVTFILKEIIDGKRTICPIPLITKDKKVIQVETRVTRIKWNDKDVLIGICHDISERERFKDQLMESDEKLISILEYSSDLFAIVNNKLEYEYINEEVYQEVLGYSKEELMGRNRVDIIHPDDLKKSLEGARIGFQTGEYKTLIRIKSKEGKWLWIESKGKTFVDSKGNTKAFLIGRDITEKKEAEQRLKESENKFLNLINNMSDVLVELDEKGKIIYISPQSLGMFGYKPEEIIGKNLSVFVHPKDLPIITKNIRKSLKYDESVTIEYRGLHKNGNYVSISVKGNKNISEGKLRYIGVLRDMTEQIESERKNREIEKNKKRLKRISQIEPEIRFWKLIQPKKDISVIEKTRKMLDTVIDTIPISIYWKDLDLKYLGCNENYANLTKHIFLNSIIGKSSHDLPVLAEAANMIHERESQVIKSGVSEYNMIESWKFDGKDEIWFNVNRIPLFDHDLNVIGILVTANDITDNKIAQQKLTKSEEKYRNFVNTISDVLAETDLKGFISYLSPQVYDIFGYDVQELLGKKILNFVHSDDKISLINTMNEAISLKKPVEAEFRIKHKNGTFIPVSVKGGMVFSENK